MVCKQHQTIMFNVIAAEYDTDIRDVGWVLSYFPSKYHIISKLKYISQTCYAYNYYKMQLGRTLEPVNKRQDKNQAK